MTCENACTTQATMQLRVIRQRFVAYANVKIIDTELINGIEQAHVCTRCGEIEWLPVEEIER